MSKPKWEKTPFDTIEQARELAEKMGLHPGVLVEQGDYCYFLMWEGRTLTTIAQSLEGGPVREKVTRKAEVPPQDPDAPRFSEKDRLHTGPWTLSDHETLEAVEAKWRKLYVNFDNIEVLHIVLYRIKQDEYEYCEDSAGVWTRVLEKKK